MDESQDLLADDHSKVKDVKLQVTQYHRLIYLILILLNNYNKIIIPLIKKFTGHRFIYFTSSMKSAGHPRSDYTPAKTVSGHFAYSSFCPLDVPPAWMFHPLDVSPR